MTRRQIFSWALYDWANSAFATAVMAGFFPLFFKQYWSASSDPTVSTFQLGLTNSIASMVIVLLAPILGAIADQGGRKKRYLALFTGMAIVMTGCLWFVAQGEWLAAVVLYGLAVIGFSGANVFYDALILQVAAPHKLDQVSGLGFGLGYLGGGLLFAFDVWMTLRPEQFGLDDAGQAVRLAFITVALWWAVFSLPLLFFVHEPRPFQGASGWSVVAAGVSQVIATLQRVRRLKAVFLFLLAYWLYIDGVDTIIRMAVDYGLALGFDHRGLISALLITQFVGFPAAIAFGYLGQWLGAKTGIFIGLTVYLGVTVWGYFMDETWEFYGLAVTIGLVQGGVQSLSRSLYARLIPVHQAGEFFGFYNMLGKFAAVLGPMLMGAVGYISKDPRLSLLPVAALFVVGAILLAFVDERKGRGQSQEAEPAR
jgi:UMF1 family MFS transporter